MEKRFLLAAVSCLGFGAHALYAQDIQTRGALRGTIRDVQGGVISNAKVTVTGTQTVDRIVTTNDVGVFEVDNLTPGTYNVRAEQRAFKTVVVAGVEVFVGKATALKLTLEVGSIAEVVTVVDALAVDQSSAAVGANLNDQLFRFPY